MIFCVTILIQELFPVIFRIVIDIFFHICYLLINKYNLEFIIIMNILTYQQLYFLQQQLEQIELPHSLKLQLPKQSELQFFEEKLYFSHSQKLQTFISKKINTGQYLKKMTNSEPNSAIKLFIYNLLALIYAPHKNNTQLHQQHTYNQELLNIVKCSLYSKEISSSQLTNSLFKIKGILAQAMLHQLFTFLINFQNNHNDNLLTLKCIDWLLQKNQKIKDILIIILRLILHKLLVKGALDFQYQLNTEEIIINLVQYFDLSYRRFDNLILFYQDSYFIAYLDPEIVFGVYFNCDHQKLQSKRYQSCQLARTEIQFALNKRSNIQNQTRKHNFLLRSSCQSQTINQSNLQTPTFNEPVDLCFGKKKRETIYQNDLQLQFAKILSDSDPLSDSEENPSLFFKSTQISNPQTPTWNLENLKFLKKQGIDSRNTINLCSTQYFKKPMDNSKEVECIQEVQQLNQQKCPHSEPQANNINNAGSFKNKISNPIQKETIITLNRSFPYDNFNQYNGKNNLFIEEKELNQTVKLCLCGKKKKQQNILTSKVVNFSFKPPINIEKQNHSQISNKEKKNIQANQSKDTEIKVKISFSPPKSKNIPNLIYSDVSCRKVPTFLKQRQNKFAHLSSIQDQQKRYQFKNPNSTAYYNKKKHQLSNTYLNGTRCSQIVQTKIQQKFPMKSKSKQKSHYSNRRESYLPSSSLLKRHDINQIPYQPKLKHSQLSLTPTQQNNPFLSIGFPFNQSKLRYTYQQNNSQNKSLSIYAPVQLIAPTVYLPYTHRSEKPIVFNCYQEIPNEIPKYKTSIQFSPEKQQQVQRSGMKSIKSQKIFKAVKNQQY